MKRLLALLLAFFTCITPALADVVSGGTLPNGFPQDTIQNLDANATILTLTTPSGGNWPNSRTLSPTARFIVTDNGAHGTYVLELQTVALGYGGTGGTTAQLGTNNLLDGTAGAAAASGDIIYRGATNWTRLPKAADGTFLSLSGGIPTWAVGGSGAPATSQYVTLALDGGLSAERVLTGTSNHITLADGGANSTITLDIGSTVCTTDTTQAITGVKTFTTPRIKYHASAALVLENSANSFQYSIFGADLAANRSLSIPDPGATAAFVLTQGTQTIAGATTFTLAPVLTSGTLSVGGNTVTIPSATDTLVNLGSAQAITGQKTITAPILNTDFRLDTTTDYIINWTANAAGSLTYTIPYTGVTSTFGMMTGTPTTTAGRVPYMDGNALATTAVGSSGQPLLGGSVPAFGDLGVAHGGTGATTLTANNVILGNGTSAVIFVAPGASGNTLTSNGTTWTSAAGGSGTVTSFSAAPTSVFDVATATTTPALSMDNQNANTALMGPVTAGSAAAPAFRTPSMSDVFGDSTNYRAAPTSGTLTGDYYTSGNWTTTNTITCNRCHLYFGGTVTIDHAITCGNSVSGGLGDTSGLTNGDGGDGSGLAHGIGGGGSVSYGLGGSGGAGGGGGGAGGAGGGSSANVDLYGGQPISFEQSIYGSGGGGGCYSGASGGAGGAGSDGLYIEAIGAITVNANITATGAAGSAGSSSSGGGGGGGGGTVDIRSYGAITTNTSKTISVAGGAGGNGGGPGGGGGGGGHIRVTCAGTLTDNATYTVSGGGAGTGGTQAAAAGSSGSSTRTGSTTPVPRRAF